LAVTSAEVEAERVLAGFETRGRVAGAADGRFGLKKKVGTDSSAG